MAYLKNPNLLLKILRRSLLQTLAGAGLVYVSGSAYAISSFSPGEPVKNAYVTGDGDTSDQPQAAAAQPNADDAQALSKLAPAAGYRAERQPFSQYYKDQLGNASAQQADVANQNAQPFAPQTTEQVVYPPDQQTAPQPIPRPVYTQPGYVQPGAQPVAVPQTQGTPRLVWVEGPRGQAVPAKNVKEKPGKKKKPKAKSPPKKAAVTHKAPPVEAKPKLTKAQKAKAAETTENEKKIADAKAAQAAKKAAADAKAAADTKAATEKAAAEAKAMAEAKAIAAAKAAATNPTPPAPTAPAPAPAANPVPPAPTALPATPTPPAAPPVASTPAVNMPPAPPQLPLPPAAIPTPPTPLPAAPAPAPAADSTPPPPPAAPVAKAAEPVINVPSMPPSAETPAVAATTKAIAEPAKNSIEGVKPTLTIGFKSTETTVPLSVKDNINKLAKQLIQNPNQRVTLVAYAAAVGDQVSTARRISLSRALSVRAYLIDAGVNNLRINVQAEGDKNPGGDPDRVDLIVQAVEDQPTP